MIVRRCIVLLAIGMARVASAQGGPEPSIVTRLAPDNVTVRAFRVQSPLRIDGRLDEDAYRNIEPISGFIQQEPDEGQPATEKTEAWILFDEVNLYICARNWDSHPEREIANELRRDSGNILGNENLTFALDTLHDRRNGYVFQTNALGALRDMAVTDDQQNQAWNGIWNVKTARFENGWTVEIAIPFKTLRYSGSGPQTWGINLRRLVKWKNEFSYLSLVPAALGTLTGRAGDYSIGALNIQTEAKPSARALSTNFSALRLKRNLLRRSNIGMLATRRGPSLGSIGGSTDASYTTGVDATMRFYKSINITSYYALTNTPTPSGANVTGSSYRGRFEYNADRYGALAEHMLIDADFRPEVGYVRRTDIRRSFGQLRFSPRPSRSKIIRKYTYQGSFDYVTDAPADQLQSKEAGGLFRIDFQSSDQFSTEYSHALRRHQVRRLVQRPLGRDAAVLARAECDAGVGIAAVRRLHRALDRFALHGHAKCADADQQPRPIQRRQQDPDVERAAAMGIHRRQRTVHRLQRWPRHPQRWFPRTAEPHLRN